MTGNVPKLSVLIQRSGVYHILLKPKKNIEFLDSWYQSEAGNRFIQAVRKVIAPKLEARFGYYGLQLNGEDWFGPQLLELSPVNNRFLLGLGDSVAVVSLKESLPIASDSVDLVILPHVLFDSADAHSVLREVERILVAEGQLIIIELDPWTIWGSWQKLAVRRQQFYSQWRVREGLSVLGFQTTACESLPMLRVDLSNVLAGWSKSDKLLNLLGALLRGCYVLTATKKVTAVTPVKQRWRRTPRLIRGGLAEPAARGVKRASD